MTTVGILLVSFLALGVFARSFDRRTRAVLLVGIIVVLIYLYIS